MENVKNATTSKALPNSAETQNRYCVDEYFGSR